MSDRNVKDNTVKVSLKLAKNSDDITLTDMMTKSFNEDTARYCGEGEEDWPPGYNHGTLAKKTLADSSKTTFLVIARQEIVGFVTVSIANHHPITQNVKATIVYLCILPTFINRGFGSQTLKMLEDKYHCQQWFVETPAYSLRNHHFYEKLGYQKYGEKDYDGARSFLYQKTFRGVAE